jgi:hypothetical protein
MESIFKHIQNKYYYRKDSYHVAVISRDKCFNEILSISGNDEKYHAEINAFRKLKQPAESVSFGSSRTSNKVKSVYLLVLRFSKTNRSLGNSRPCFHCLCKMRKLSKIKNINIKDVYYSSEESINKEKFIKMDRAYVSSGNRYV